MLARLARLHPFQTPEAQRLAILFAVVYFAQGMWNLPAQTMTIVLKERGLSSSAVADFFLLSTIPWVIKPGMRSYEQQPRVFRNPLGERISHSAGGEMKS